MIYVYALTDPAGAVPPDVRGLEHQPLGNIVVGDVSATFTAHAEIAVAPVAQNLWRHEQVVESFMRNPGLALLPVRFGTTFPDEAHLEDVLRRNQGVLKAGLDRVRGCVELGLRVSRTSAEAAALPQADFSTGREYMAARLAEHRLRCDADQLAAELESALMPLAREMARREARAPQVVLSSAFLVNHDRAEEFAATVRTLAAAHPSLRLLCTGPWPAYHFAPSLQLAEALHG